MVRVEPRQAYLDFAERTCVMNEELRRSIPAPQPLMPYVVEQDRLRRVMGVLYHAFYTWIKPSVGRPKPEAPSSSEQAVMS